MTVAIVVDVAITLGVAVCYCRRCLREAVAPYLWYPVIAAAIECSFSSVGLIDVKNWQNMGRDLREACVAMFCNGVLQWRCRRTLHQTAVDRPWMFCALFVPLHVSSRGKGYAHGKILSHGNATENHGKSWKALVIQITEYQKP